MFLPSVMLLITSAVPFFWHAIPWLEPYTLQLIAGLVLIFFLARHAQNITKIVIITLIVLLLLLGTWGLSSPLFPLLDFLLFTISLLTLPALGQITALALTLLFLLNNPNINIGQAANLIFLLLMAPVAKLIGTQYLKLLEAQKQINILSNQSDHLNKKISQQGEQTLLWLSLNFSNKLHQTLDIVSQMMSQLSRLPYHQKEKLNTLYQDLKELFKSGQELKEKVEKINEN